MVRALGSASPELVHAAKALGLVGAARTIDFANREPFAPRPVGGTLRELPLALNSAVGEWLERADASSKILPEAHILTAPHQAPNPEPCASPVIVDVEGKVAHPGVLTLPAGSRVYEALAAAGGALPGVDATGLDLARLIADGEQLRVGIAGEPSPAVGVVSPSGGAKGKRKGGRVVNLNTATLEELESVPDVGPAMAQRILDWRAAHGRFASVGELRQVRGIGERKFAEMRDSVTV